MKAFLFTLILLITSSLVKADETILQTKATLIDQYTNTQQGTIELPTHFGQPLILNKEQVRKLKGKKIFHVDLVYTQYKESEDFDQKSLNEQRINQLERLLPRLSTDKPNWTVYEQVGAKDRETAKTFFHGFVIHFGEDVAYSGQKEFFKDIQVPFSKVGINNQEGGYAQYYSGSMIQMNKNIVYHQNGELVQGYYDLHYREFRNQAEIALSGIPMNYNEHGKDEVFHSVGMYEIRAYKDGEELVLHDDALVHFQCTEALPNVNFYSMSEDGEWTEEAPIRLRPAQVVSNGTRTEEYWMVSGPTPGSKIRFRRHVPEEIIDQGNYQGQSRVTITTEEDKNELGFELELEQMKRLMHFELADKNSKFHDVVSGFDTMGTRNTVRIFAKDSIAFLELMLGRKYDKLNRYIQQSHSVNEADFTVYSSWNNADIDSQLVVVEVPIIPEGYGLVQGLKSKNFGVFNCDQTSRLNSPMAWSPTYFDSKTTEPLQALYLTCVIDMDKNLSLSFEPNHIYTGKGSRTKLLVFSLTNEIYLFDGALKPQSLSNGFVDVDMINITDKVNSSSDLKKILGV